MSLDNAFRSASDFRWLYTDFNGDFAKAERRPYLRGKPAAVAPVETDSTCAAAVSDEAKARGGKAGPPIYEENKMCPGLICVLTQHAGYAEYLHRIQEEVDTISPSTW